MVSVCLSVCQQSIREDLEWMGWKPVQTTYSSDSFQVLYDMAIKLIEVSTRRHKNEGGVVQEHCRTIIGVGFWCYFRLWMKECRMLFVLGTFDENVQGEAGCRKSGYAPFLRRR